MGIIMNSFAKSLRRVSKRHIVADVLDTFNRQKEEMDHIKQEQEEFAAMKEMADYCDLKLIQSIDGTGVEHYLLMKPAPHGEKDRWVIESYFEDIDKVKKHLIALKTQRDREYEQQALKAQTDVERDVL